MSLKNTLFYLMMGTCVNVALSMDAFPSKDNAQNPVFKSSQEMINYGFKLFNLAEKRKYDLVLKNAYPKPDILFAPISRSDHEGYLYCRVMGLIITYEGLVDKNRANSAECIKYYDKALEEVNAYLEQYGNFISQVQSFNERMILHRFHFYKKLGHFYFCIGEFKNDFNKDLREYFQKAASSYEKALDCGAQFQKSFPKSEAVKDVIECVPDIQFSLLSNYCLLAQCVLVNERASFVKKAREIRNGFKSVGLTDKHENACKTLEILEKKFDLEEKESLRVNSERIRKYSKTTISIVEKDLLKSVGAIHNELEDNNLHKGQILTRVKNLHTILGSQQADRCPKAIQGLFDIENELRAHLTEGMSSSLETVYEALRTLLGGEFLITTFWDLITPFIMNGDLGEGIHRAEILKNIETNQLGGASYKARFIAAALKNLQGDHEDWLKLESELQEKIEQKKQKKKAAKEKKHQQKVESIQLHVTEKKAEEEKRLAAKADKKTKPSTSSSAKRTKFEEPEPEYPEEEVLSSQQRKLEKKQRHEEAKVKRSQNPVEQEKNQENTTSVSIPVERKLSKKEQRDLILSSSNQMLAELYNLSSGPLAVDQEIENNTWRFTREEFKTYMEAVGCIYKSGNGIHDKASLPKAILIMQGDNLVTILNDFGGALTLPLWDKDYVPNYLQTQILEARKNLRAFKILQIQAKG